VTNGISIPSDLIGKDMGMAVNDHDSTPAPMSDGVKTGFSFIGADREKGGQNRERAFLGHRVSY